MLSESIKKLAEGSDKLDEIKDLIAEAESYETQLSEAKNKIDEMTAQVANLRDVNMRLFLSVTNPVDESEPEEPKPLTFEEKFRQLEESQGGK